ncbi:MAG: NUDIX hydrolase [Bacteroidia bacterium]
MSDNNKFYLSENDMPLKDYFVFGLSVDCVVFGYQQGKIKVLLIERDAEPFRGSWALPGDLVSPKDDLLYSANTVLTNLTGLENIFMEQFYTFGSVDRHPVGRVATVAYYSLVKSSNYDPVASSWAKSLKWFDIRDLPELAFDHEEILNKGIRTLQRRVRYRPVGFELLPNKFTLKELQVLYEALLEVKFDKPNFRKKILGMDLLIPLDEMETNVSHRPAKLFRFDEERYQQLKSEGFNFDV